MPVSPGAPQPGKRFGSSRRVLARGRKASLERAALEISTGYSQVKILQGRGCGNPVEIFSCPPPPFSVYSKSLKT